jgi:hypothetical protein
MHHDETVAEPGLLQLHHILCGDPLLHRRMRRELHPHHRGYTGAEKSFHERT